MPLASIVASEAPAVWKPERRFERSADGAERADRRTSLLDRVAGTRRDPHGARAGARARIGARRDALLRHQPRDGIAGLRRPRAGLGARADARAVPGGPLP